MDDLRERIEAAYERLGRLHYRTPEWRVEWDDLREMKAEYARLFGASRGWRLSPKPISIRQLRTGCVRNTINDWLRVIPRPVLDHPEFFRHPVRPYRPAAIVTHAYCGEREIFAAAADVRLDCEILPWSWYFPGHTVAAVLTAPGR